MAPFKCYVFLIITLLLPRFAGAASPRGPRSNGSDPQGDQPPIKVQLDPFAAPDAGRYTSVLMGLGALATTVTYLAVPEVCPQYRGASSQGRGSGQGGG